MINSIFQFFIGVDISKETLDYTILQGKQLIAQARIANSAGGLSKLKKHLKKLKIPLAKTLICCENTGIFNHPLITWSKKDNANLWIENAKVIKDGMGITRDKSDEIDSYRIALYAARFEDRSVLYEPPREVIQKLKVLTSTRRNILEMKSKIKRILSGPTAMEASLSLEIMKRHYKGILADLTKQVKQVDQDIKELVASDAKLKKQFKIVCSVEGVGPVMAAVIIAESGEFERIKEARKMACHAGVAPFGKTSGTSINVKPKVSPCANKRIKNILFMGAMAAAHGTGELADYYQRKTKEGKHPWCVYIALANKILHRIYACIRDGRMYEKHYKRPSAYVKSTTAQDQVEVVEKKTIKFKVKPYAAPIVTQSVLVEQLTNVKQRRKLSLSGQSKTKVATG